VEGVGIEGMEMKGDEGELERKRIDI